MQSRPSTTSHLTPKKKTGKSRKRAPCGGCQSLQTANYRLAILNANYVGAWRLLDSFSFFLCLILRKKSFRKGKGEKRQISKPNGLGIINNSKVKRARHLRSQQQRQRRYWHMPNWHSWRPSFLFCFVVKFDSERRQVRYLHYSKENLRIETLRLESVMGLKPSQ